MTDTRTVAVRPDDAKAGTIPADGLSGVAAAALHVLASAALLILLISTALLLFGTSENLETRQWVLAYVVALPAGILIAGRQTRDLNELQAAWALALSSVALSVALVWRSTGRGDDFHHVLIGVAAAMSLASPVIVRRLGWLTLGSAAAGYTAAGVAASIALVPFVPDGALTGGRLLSALVLAAVAMGVLLLTGDRQLPRRARRAVDVILLGVLVLVVLSLPDIRNFGYILVHHQGFYLGPVNAIAEGRPMLDGTWSQYGVFAMDALRAVFAVVPFGYGGLSLIVGALTALQYATVYVTLRMAIRSQILVASTLAVEVLAHLLGLDANYLAVPSTSPLRFGFPYLIVFLAVASARWPERARQSQVAQLVVVALAVVWSFETFVYTAATYGMIVLAVELAAGPGALRRVVRSALVAAAVSAAAIAVYTAITIALAGGAHWGPYLDYIKLYSTEGFGQLPITFLSPGPIMGGVIFLSILGTVHLARTQSLAASSEQVVALAGFGGAAASFFTYYLGRSHPDNLLNILLPTVVLGGLWAALLLQTKPSTGRLIGLGMVLVAGGMLSVSGWNFVKVRWQDTAFAQTVPYADGKPAGQGRSVRTALRALWNQPVFDPRAVTGADLLNRNLRKGAPALVITEPELQTEIMIRARRRNLLPINHPIEDNLLVNRDRVIVAAAEKVPAGTLLLTTPTPPTPGQTGSLGGNPIDFVRIQVLALNVLKRRFTFLPVATAPNGLRLVRLVRRPRR